MRLHVAALRFFFVKTLKRRYLLDDTPYPKVPGRGRAPLTLVLAVHPQELARGRVERDDRSPGASGRVADPIDELFASCILR